MRRACGEPAVRCGAPGRTRTADAGLRTASLCPLSYGGAASIVPRAWRRPVVHDRDPALCPRARTFGASKVRCGGRSCVGVRQNRAQRCFACRTSGRRIVEGHIGRMLPATYPHRAPRGPRLQSEPTCTTLPSPTSSSTRVRAAGCATRRARSSARSSTERETAGLPTPPLVERDIETDPAWERAFFASIPVVELGDRRLELATSAAKLRRLLSRRPGRLTSACPAPT